LKTLPSVRPLNIPRKLFLKLKKYTNKNIKYSPLIKTTPVSLVPLEELGDESITIQLDKGLNKDLIVNRSRTPTVPKSPQLNVK
jgi:hypothetical protein